jgi:hypothetical protein
MTISYEALEHVLQETKTTFWKDQNKMEQNGSDKTKE